MEALTILEMNDVEKSFNGVPVLKKANFELRKGEVHALMGGNGAGKSTLMKILTGVYRKDSGMLLLDGQPVELATARQAGEILQAHPEVLLHTQPGLTGEIFAGDEEFFARRAPLRRARRIDDRLVDPLA